MKRILMSQIRKLLCGGGVCFALTASADVVTNDYFTDVSSPTTLLGVTNIVAKCKDVNISSDLTLDDRTFLWLRGESEGSPAYVNLAPTANDVTLTVQGNSGFFTAYRYSMGSDASSEWGQTGIEPASEKSTAPTPYYYVRMGVEGGAAASTGRARIVLKTNPKFGSNAFSGFMAKYLSIETSVSPDSDSGMIDFLEIPADVIADIAQIHVKATAYPARILFKGGTLLRNNIMKDDNTRSPLAPASGATLVLQGVNGADIRLKGQYIQRHFTARNGGAVRFVGKDVRLVYTGNKPGSNFYACSLETNDKVTWEHTGDLRLEENFWLQMRHDDLLPWGPKTGSLSLGGNTAVKESDAAAGTAIPYCCLDLYGTRQHLNGVTSVNTGTWQGVVTNSATATGTLVLGDGDVSGTLNAKCTANVAVEKVGTGLLTVRSTTGESLTVSAGTATFSDSTFANVTAAADTTLAGAVAVTGAFTTSGATPPSAAGLSLSLASGATVSVTGETPLVLDTLTVGGTAVAKGSYTTATASWLKAGAVTVLATAGETVSAADVAWTAAGSTTAASDAANWASAVDFSALGTRPVFATGGTAAQLDGLCNFAGILFNAANGFTLSSADESTGAANLYGDIALAAADGARRTYEVAAPLTLVTDQTVTLPTNVTLKLTGGLTGAAGLEMVGTKLGEKTYDYDDAGGELVLENARISGPISHTLGGGWLVLRGDVGCPGDASALSLNYCRARDGKTWYSSSVGAALTGRTRLEGATVRKPVTIDGIGQVTTGCDRWLIGAANTENTFKELVTCGPSTTFRAETGSTITFEKGITVENGGLNFLPVDSTCTDTRYVIAGPLTLNSANRTFGAELATRIVFRGTGSSVRHYVEPGMATLAFEIDDAFTDTGFHFTKAEGGEIDLGTTHQKMKWLSSGKTANYVVTNDVANPTSWGLRGTVRGAWPATLEVTSGVVDGAQSVTNCGVQFTGWVALAKSGSGVHRMLKRDYESYGDVEVSGGRLEFDAGATWRNGTNVTVRGTGTLKLGSGKTFRDDVRVTAVGPGWTLDLTGTQKAASLTVDGVAMPEGVYGPGHATLGSHFTGTGRLRVGKLGGCLIIR